MRLRFPEPCHRNRNCQKTFRSAGGIGKISEKLQNATIPYRGTFVALMARVPDDDPTTYQQRSPAQVEQARKRTAIEADTERR